MFFDELDIFLEGFRKREIVHSETKPPQEDEDIIDELLDLYLLAYYEGSKDAGKELMMDVEPSVEDAKRAINRPIADKTFRERVTAYLNGDMGETTGTPAEAIARVAETDSVRIYNEAKLDTARYLGASIKTWHTMEDNRVRDTHTVLDGVSAPIDGYFYTYTGAKALAPGQFGDAAEDCNCRCFITVK
jgi:hypothetical protein